ncbi:predicted protein [Chaetomium globosum CBS 148.51]|uniref:Uncharacterized protein n=1 Tax=Chaetomium globosum (strain ATCC 6205 / CBS 148.51 / DSM 1962 / NBRC 6347 / NRRL 1970) TaxID=306901 RepID=Q2HF87_CHAGB|nr:uncharacterized protein CHGG_01117 [Chaetomium globosum CBS 148.51]EAQ92882.1 predicted protein [Chaetomium globosum CBS 148.51]
MPKDAFSDWVKPKRGFGRACTSSRSVQLRLSGRKAIGLQWIWDWHDTRSGRNIGCAITVHWPGSEGGDAGGVSQPVLSNGVSRKDKNLDGDKERAGSLPVECSETFTSTLLSDSRFVHDRIRMGSGVLCG